MVECRVRARDKSHNKNASANKAMKQGAARTAKARWMCVLCVVCAFPVPGPGSYPLVNTLVHFIYEKPLGDFSGC